MPVPQQKFRELVFQILYSKDLGHAAEDDMIQLMMMELSVTRKTVRQALERVQNILSKQEEIDAMIAKTSTSYNFERIQTVERNILRLGTYELFHDKEIPQKVAISEAMRLARKFGTPESASFINAVLDNLYKSSIGETGNSSELAKSVDALLQLEEIAREASTTQTMNSTDSNDE